MQKRRVSKNRGEMTHHQSSDNKKHKGWADRITIVTLLTVKPDWVWVPYLRIRLNGEIQSKLGLMFVDDKNPNTFPF